MKIYDEAIKDLLKVFDGYEAKDLSIDNATWSDVGDKSLILRSDMAYELGGGTCDAVSAMAVTCDEALVPKDQVLLYGPDLPELKSDCSYARISLIRVKEDSLGDGNDLYNAVRKIEYVRYHVSPEGYMVRISANNGREPVRVGKEALSKGLDFSKVGKLFLDRYHENQNIEAVKMIFITLPSFDYRDLNTRAKYFDGITGTIDHIFKNIIMDCGVCSLKPICDEVEGLKELHFSQAQSN